MSHSDPQITIPAGQPIDTSPNKPYSIRRVRLGLGATLIGFSIFLIGARPGLFGMDRSLIIGFVQIAAFLIGLGIMCIGGYISLMALWKNGQKNILADIGQRLVATGYVIAVFAGMADVFGIGSHGLPKVPYFGPIQAAGVQIGELMIAVGFILIIPFKRFSHLHDEPSIPKKK